MAKSRNQKTKILIIEQMLLRCGENEIVTMQQILNELENRGITAERKSIYDDMEALRDFGIKVRFRRGRPGGYYIEGGSSVKVPVEYTEPVVETKAQEPAAKRPEPKKELSEVFKAVPAPNQKPLRLSVAPDAMEEVNKYFTFGYEIKEQTDEATLIVVSQELNPQFYGWLTAMGEKICLVKPRKAAAAYRDYLKSLARGYKSLFE